jgi:hypothetical protein
MPEPPPSPHCQHDPPATAARPSQFDPAQRPGPTSLAPHDQFALSHYCERVGRSSRRCRVGRGAQLVCTWTVARRRTSAPARERERGTSRAAPLQCPPGAGDLGSGRWLAAGARISRGIADFSRANASLVAAGQTETRRPTRGSTLTRMRSMRWAAVVVRRRACSARLMS